MKKVLWLFMVLILSFGCGLVLTTAIQNNIYTDNKTEFSDTSLPIMYLEVNGTRANLMVGYKEKMQANYIRNSIVPLTKEKEMTLTLNPYNYKVKGIAYEVRTSDGSKIVENRTIKDINLKSDSINIPIKLSALLLINQEYSMEIKVETNEGDLFYYTRVVPRTNVNLKEYVDFVNMFYRACLNKDEALNLASYLESVESINTVNYNHIDIHSSLQDVSWGKIKPTLISEGIPTIKEINPTTASITVDYIIGNQKDNDVERLAVRDFYRLRYDNGKIRLLDFRRSAKSIFNGESVKVIDKLIELGVGGENVNYQTNSKNSVVAFVQNSQLWSYTPRDGRINQVFSLNSEDNTRGALEDNHGIKIIQVHKNGNIDFVLYGYINRGPREGYCGISVCRYNQDKNLVEEKAFISGRESYEFLKRDILTVSYVSKTNNAFLLYGDNLYKVDINKGKYKIIEKNVNNGSVVISNNSENAAWIVKKGENKGSILEINFPSTKTRIIKPKNDEYAKVFGYMNNDLVYGFVKKENRLSDNNGHVTEGLKELFIENINGKLKKTYNGNDLYINEVSIKGALMEIKLGRKDNNTYTLVKVDHIINNKKGEDNKVYTTTILDENLGVINAIGFEKKPATDSVFVRYFKMSSKSSPLIDFDTELPLGNMYYVYAYGQLNTITKYPNKAINLANDNVGVVLNKQQQYVWERGNRKDRLIMNVADVPAIMKTGNWNAVEFKKGLEKQGDYLDLSGCTLEEILYEVGAFRPVIAKTGDNSSLVIMGYDPFNVYVFDGENKKPKAIASDDAKIIFENAGNIFISYIENNNSK